MTDIIRPYLDAMTAFREADRKVQEAIGLVCDVAEALSRNPGNFYFSNAGPMPAEVMLNSQKIYDGDKWPSAKDFQRLLWEWHDSLNNVRNVWRAIPGEYQNTLQAPPTSVSQKALYHA